MSQQNAISKQSSISHAGITVRDLPGIWSFSVVAACILAVSLAFFVLSVNKPFMGINVFLSDHEWRVESIDDNGAAYLAGIREGDRPAEINGQPAETFLADYEEPGIVFGILIRELTVVNEHGDIKSVTLKRSSPPAQAVVEVLSRFVASLLFWAVGVFVFLKRPRNAAAALLCLCSLVFGLALTANLAADRAAPSALQFSVAATIFGPWLLLHFFLILPDERGRLRGSRLPYLLYLPPAITLVLFFLIGYKDGQPVQWFRNARFLEIGLVFVATIGVAIFNYFGPVSARTKQQMKFILAGCLAALIPLLILYMLPRMVWQRPLVSGTVSMLFLVFVPLGMGFAVVTQKLMDINVIIRRSVIYGLITVVMAVLLAASIFFVTAFRQSIGVPEQILIALVLGGVATVLFGPLKNGTEAVVDRLFYKDRYDYRQIIQSMSAALKSVKDINEISRLVVGTMVDTLNLAGGALFVRNQRSSFNVGATQGTFSDSVKQDRLLALISQQAELPEFPNPAPDAMTGLAFLIPLTAGEKEVGFLCLSHKTSRQAFSPDDLFLLQGLTSLAAMALHSGMLLRDVSMRDTFVSIASHELRTPLTAILGYADLLSRRDPPDETKKRWIGHILDNGYRVTAMVDELLNVSRIQSGRSNINLEKVKLCDVLEGTLSLTGEGATKHEFVVDIEPDLPEVRVDRDKFGQVIGNLLSNAVKYSPCGGRITLAARCDKRLRQVVVSISDQGIGIGPDDRDRLFTTFHRIQRPETQGIRGSGLGLYIAKEWTEAMGGKIWLESELNKGSTFFVAVPANRS